MSNDQSISVVGFIAGGALLVAAGWFAISNVSATGQTYFDSTTVTCGSLLSPSDPEGDASTIFDRTDGFSANVACADARDGRELFATLAGFAGAAGIAIGFAKRSGRASYATTGPIPIPLTHLPPPPVQPPSPPGGQSF